MHVVTEEEAQAGAYSVEDVVMPLPGSQVQYPEYKTSAERAEESSQVTSIRNVQDLPIQNIC